MFKVVRLARFSITQRLELHDRSAKVVDELKVFGLVVDNGVYGAEMALVRPRVEERPGVTGQEERPHQRTGAGDDHVLNHAVGEQRRLRGQAHDGGKEGVCVVRVLGRVRKLLIHQPDGARAMV